MTVETYTRALGGVSYGLARRARVVGLRWGTVAAVILAWQAAAAAFFPDSLFIPAPSDIIAHGLSIFSDPGVIAALRVTAVEFVVAFGIAASAGVTIALLLSATTLTRTLGRDVVQVLFTLPQVPLFPLLILFVGLGMTSKIVFGVSHGIFPVILATLSGVSEVGERLPNAIRAMGGGPWTVAWKAVLPSALPSVLTGLRVGAALCLAGVLLAELLASSGGIGATAVLLSSSFEADQLFALILAICVAAMIINWAMMKLQARLTRWKP